MAEHYRREKRAVVPRDLAARELIVPRACAGMRLDQALAQLLPQHSRMRLKSWIDDGLVTIDGEIVQPRHRVGEGEAVMLREATIVEALGDRPEALPLVVVDEDDAILVIDKPAGLVVHPGAGNRTGTLLNALLHHSPMLADVPRAGIVHRLDKDTSGLLVAAKTLEAHTDLVRQLAARSVLREYLALVRGDMTKSVIVDAPIGRHPQRRTSMAVVARGKPARTHVDVVARGGAATLVRCRLETGRTHQIRVHLASIGHALVGDPLYVGRSGRAPAALEDFPRQALHAQRLGLSHPTTRRKRSWTSPLPDDFAALLDAIDIDASAGSERR